MKKLIWIVILFLCIISCSYQAKDDILFLGNDLKNLNFDLKEEKNLKVNDNYLMQDGYISFLYSFIDQDAKKNNVSLKNALKSSKNIFIHIGTSDIMRININQTDLSDDYIATQKELFSYYFFLTIEEIREIFKEKIFLLSPYIVTFKSNEEKIKLEILLDTFYEVFQEIASYFSCILIDLRDVSLLIDKNERLDICDYIYQKVNYGI